MCILKALLGGSMSQFFYLGPSFHFMEKKPGSFLSFLCKTIFYIS